MSFKLEQAKKALYSGKKDREVFEKDREVFRKTSRSFCDGCAVITLPEVGYV
jgi:hypothetical protein